MLPKIERSYWKHSVANRPLYPRITENLSVDVAIVGGGITGLSCAYLLKKSGLSVAVLEKNRLASGTTGGTTGKVSSQHGLIYNQLRKTFGVKTARLYASAYMLAFERMARIIHSEKLDCDWQYADNYVYTADPAKVRQFDIEAKTAMRLGLPASFETKSELPFDIAAAVKFTNQGKLNAAKYVFELAKRVHDGKKNFIFEKSDISTIHDGHFPYVRCDKYTVKADNIILATKIPPGPLVARASYAGLVYPHTSYIVAGLNPRPIKGMYISPDKNHYSLMPVNVGSRQLLLIGGENHIPGLGSPTRRHQKLAGYASVNFGISSIRYRWKAMDYIAYDRLPVIGKLYPWSKHVYTATGYKKWGLSTSMVSAMVLCDLINGQRNPWADVFSSSRLKPLLYIPKTVVEEVKLLLR